MSLSHAVNHLATVAGLTAACYFAWSMVVTPAHGPLPGRLLPLAVGVVGTLTGLLLFAGGAYREYVTYRTVETEA